MRHQKWQCNQFKSAGEMLLQSPILTSTYKVRLLEAVDVHVSFAAGQDASLLNLDELDVSLREYKWITIGSNKFKVNESLIVCQLSNNFSNVRQRRGAFRSAFGLITHIL